METFQWMQLFHPSYAHRALAMLYIGLSVSHSDTSRGQSGGDLRPRTSFLRCMAAVSFTLKRAQQILLPSRW